MINTKTIFYLFAGLLSFGSLKLCGQTVKPYSNSLSIDRIELTDSIGNVKIYIGVSQYGTSAFSQLNNQAEYIAKEIYATIRHENEIKIDTLSIIEVNLVENLIDVINEKKSLKFIVSASLPDNYDGRKLCADKYIFSIGYKIESDGSKTQITSHKSVFFGGSARCVYINKQENKMPTFFFGVFILVNILAILAFVAPVYQDMKFRKEHVKRYREIKQKGRTKSDPLTQKPFEDSDLVVTDSSREKVMSLSTWKYFREGSDLSQVGKFIELFPPQLKPRGFFTQRGMFRRFNWLWFGAVGGFLSFIVWTLLQQIDKQPYLQQLSNLLDNDKLQVSTAVLEQTFLGIAMGAGITFALALVEELGQSRRFKFRRILLRVGIGILAAYFIFLLESALMAKFVPVEWLRYMMGWTLLGAALGWIVTFFSSIEPLSGLKGGGLAGFIGFLVYYPIGILAPTSVIPHEYVQVISYITYGGVLGYTLYTIVSSLKTYELRCISPAYFSAWKSPVSKWLKSSDIVYISIGKDPANRVYIKWEDSEVAAHHARLSLIKEVPHITPDGGEVLVNNRLINNSTPLVNSDRIQLGINSNTILQFVVKESK